MLCKNCEYCYNNPGKNHASCHWNFPRCVALPPCETNEGYSPYDDDYPERYSIIRENLPKTEIITFHQFKEATT